VEGVQGEGKGKRKKVGIAVPGGKEGGVNHIVKNQEGHKKEGDT